MVKIEVYGIKEVLPDKGGGCGSPSGCDLSLTIGEQYDNLKSFLEKMNIHDKVEMEFIDVRYIDNNKYKDLKKMMDTGFAIPYVFINQKIRFFGAIPQKAIYNEISKVLNG
ncbi:hypothetical protein [Clostridium thermarum]|uniref:hypothetical protein n=1 Tax=Clostridium thermarum TaxID=1716543 RepID=UPI001121F470|nr:hypothetical protein [Clostridium thermarum]